MTRKTKKTKILKTILIIAVSVILTAIITTYIVKEKGWGQTVSPLVPPTNFDTARFN